MTNFMTDEKANYIFSEDTEATKTTGTQGGNSSTQGDDDDQAQTASQTSSSQQNSNAGVDIELLQKELEESKSKLLELTNISQRALADLQNFRRRSEEEKTAFISFANASLISELLPALDNAHRALEHAPTDTQVQEWLQGVTATLKQFEGIFKEKGLKPIDALNQEFNPEFHEALTSEKGSKNTIVKEFEKGYILNDKVLRRSKVAVGNGEE